MRTTIVTVLAAATLALAACTAAPKAVPITDPTTTTTVAPAAAAVTVPPTATYRPGELRPQDRAFLSNLNDFWRTADNATAIEGGELVCTQLRDGQDKTQVLKMLVEIAGLDDATNLMHAAAVAYCPEQLVGIK